MKPNLIYIKINYKSNIILNKALELYKLSVGNNIINLNYQKNRKESSNQNLGIIYYKKYIKKNIGKMKYKITENQTKIIDKEFILKNKKRAKIIINNKHYELKEYIYNKKYNHSFKIEIKFLDNIFYLKYMFNECKSLSYINNFQSINTKYLKAICSLFSGCNSLLYIDDISEWNINNVNY